MLRLLPSTRCRSQDTCEGRQYRALGARAQARVCVHVLFKDAHATQFDCMDTEQEEARQSNVRANRLSSNFGIHARVRRESVNSAPVRKLLHESHRFGGARGGGHLCTAQRSDTAGLRLLESE